MSDVGNDLIAWNATHDGIFTIKSTYFLIEPQSANTYNSIYKSIWK